MHRIGSAKSHPLACTRTFHSSRAPAKKKMAPNAASPSTNAHRIQREPRTESALTGRYAADASRHGSPRGPCVTDHLESRDLLRPIGAVKAGSRSHGRFGTLGVVAGAG